MQAVTRLMQEITRRLKMGFTHTKRPFSDDESCQLTFKKHQRQLDCNDEISAFVEIVSCNNVPQKICYPGEERFTRSQLEDKNPSPTTLEPLVTSNKQLVYSEGCGIPHTAFVNGSGVPITYREDDAISDSAVQVSCSLVEYQRDVYSSLVDYPPQKLVLIGPDHQADIPMCCPQGATSSFSHMGMPASTMGAEFYLMDNEEDMKRFQGTCVIPMPDSDLRTDQKETAGHGRIDCGCMDHGSIRCVRQHIMEEREQLKINLGEERFMQLGFCEMGEEVAEKWSTEEEQVFHEVVYSNPFSLSRDFWNQLTLIFPSRTKKELVGFYFNVFVLRRRAEQNRWDPFNVDSDDDEWQLSDTEEPEVTEEDEDSAVDDHDGNHGGIFHVDGDYHDCDDDDNDDEDDGDDGEVDIPGEHNELLDRNCRVDPTSQPKEDTGNSTEDQDPQDESCMSYECHQSRDDLPCNLADVAWRQHGMANNHSNTDYLNNSLDGLITHGYAMEPCDHRVWDVGYLTDPLKEIDFLSTCNMMKEVFGEESWTMRDGPGIS